MTTTQRKYTELMAMAGATECESLGEHCVATGTHSREACPAIKADFVSRLGAALALVAEQATHAEALALNQKVDAAAAILPLTAQEVADALVSVRKPKNNGWCDAPAHAGNDHARSATCVNFIDEEVVLAAVDAEAEARHIKHAPMCTGVHGHGESCSR